jgi:rare lipoprotein A
MRAFIPILGFLILMGFSQGLYAQFADSSTRGSVQGKIQVGIASYYADKFEGKRTSSGELYRKDQFSAAHNSLALGTWIRVTNLRNNKSVVVKVNDRLHYRNKRLVDLSRAAATQLGYVGKGLTKVRVEVLGKKPPATNK